MTYTDLLGIGGLVYLLGKYVDTYCCMVSCFEPIVLIAVTLVIRMKVSICCYGQGSDCWYITEKSFQINYRLCLTFGGMGLLPYVAVVRVFALVVRCRVMLFFVYSRVGKNRDTRRETPAAAGAGRTAGHLTVLFSQNILVVRKGNDLYRPVRRWPFS